VAPLRLGPLFRVSNFTPIFSYRFQESNPG
jgi:hypothetical protein